jgi:protein-S-isoprenylcysteine O-methyltransferase Ste14
MSDVTNGADEERASVQPDRGRAVVTSDVRTRRIGWSLVVVQALLLLLLVLLPKRRSLLAPPDFLDVLGIILMVGGLALAIIALLSLGAALTPTPVPQQSAALRTGGIYSLVRHPIYSGILVAALGFTLAVGSIWQVILWVALIAFFYAKAFWEDRLLAEKHGVAWFDYADHVSSFIPRFWGSR